MGPYQNGDTSERPDEGARQNGPLVILGALQTGLLPFVAARTLSLSQLDGRMSQGVHNDVSALADALLIDGGHRRQVGRALGQVLDEEVELARGLVVVDDSGGAVGHGDEEELLHAAVEAGDALQVERLGRLVDHGAVGHGVRSHCKRKTSPKIRKQFFDFFRKFQKTHSLG